MTDRLTNHRITAQLIGSGYAALHLVDVTDDHGTYTDIQQTGIGRYKTLTEAQREAQEWAEGEGIRYEP